MRGISTAESSNRIGGPTRRCCVFRRCRPPIPTGVVHRFRTIPSTYPCISFPARTEGNPARPLSFSRLVSRSWISASRSLASSRLTSTENTSGIPSISRRFQRLTGVGWIPCRAAIARTLSLFRSASSASRALNSGVNRRLFLAPCLLQRDPVVPAVAETLSRDPACRQAMRRRSCGSSVAHGDHPSFVCQKTPVVADNRRQRLRSTLASNFERRCHGHTPYLPAGAA